MTQQGSDSPVSGLPLKSSHETPHTAREQSPNIPLLWEQENKPVLSECANDMYKTEEKRKRFRDASVPPPGGEKEAQVIRMETSLGAKAAGGRALSRRGRKTVRERAWQKGARTE